VKLKNKRKRKLDDLENLREYLINKFSKKIPESGYVCHS